MYNVNPTSFPCISTNVFNSALLISAKCPFPKSQSSSCPQYEHQTIEMLSLCQYKEKEENLNKLSNKLTRY